MPVDHLATHHPFPLAETSTKNSFFASLSAQALYMNIILFLFNLLIPGEIPRKARAELHAFFVVLFGVFRLTNFVSSMRTTSAK